MERTLDKDRREQNREDTADPRHVVFTGDRLLSKVIVRIRGVRIAALLFEATKNEDFEAAGIDPSDAEPMYSSATISVTQESGDQVGDASYSSVRRDAAHSGTVSERDYLSLATWYGLGVPKSAASPKPRSDGFYNE